MKKIHLLALGALTLGAFSARAEVKPFLSIVPHACGVNILEGVAGPSWVNEVCLSGLAGTSQQVIHITFTDGSEVAYPIVATKQPNRSETILYAATGTVTRAADGGPVRLGTMPVTQVRMSVSGRTPRGTSFQATLAPVRVTAGIR